jgi:branched-chain amino acid transport system permease protein
MKLIITFLFQMLLAANAALAQPASNRSALIIGVGEKLSEVYLGPMVGGGIEIWFAYVLALVFLLFRPQGLFGEKIIDRV